MNLYTDFNIMSLCVNISEEFGLKKNATCNYDINITAALNGKESLNNRLGVSKNYIRFLAELSMTYTTEK